MFRIEEKMMGIDTSRELDDWLHLIKIHAWVAWTKVRKPAECTMDDLIQEGVTVFLNACNDFNGGKATTFRTFLIGCLRNHFTSFARQTYRGRPRTDFSHEEKSLVFQKEEDKHRPGAASTTLDAVQMRFLIQSFNPEELKYITAILACAHISPKRRRKAARQNLNISFEREVKLRNSIRDKIRK